MESLLRKSKTYFSLDCFRICCLVDILKFHAWEIAFLFFKEEVSVSFASLKLYVSVILWYGYATNG